MRICVVSLSLILLFSWVMVSADPPVVRTAELIRMAAEKKAKGDYLGAARIHPTTACRAWLLWCHACSLVGKRDGNGDWYYDEDKRHNNALALRYLREAEVAIEGGGPDCPGKDRDVLISLIHLVRRQIRKHP